LDVKKQIHSTQGHEPEWQKLIFAGKILNDDQTVKSCNINESDFLVLMVRKVFQLLSSNLHINLSNKLLTLFDLTGNLNHPSPRLLLPLLLSL
jgi:hypothetical protein